MSTDVKYWFLRNLDLFSALNDTEIREFCAFSEYNTLKQDTVIYPHTKEIDKVYVLNQGRIKVAFCIKKNLEVVAEILKEGDVFGALTLESVPNNNSEFAQVLSEEASFFSFRSQPFKNILKRNAVFAITFSKAIAAKLNIISKKYCDLVFKDVRSRVLNFFMLHAQYEGTWTGNKAEINMFCTQKDIANFTASTRQTVSSVISDLVKEKKIIFKGRSKVVIPDITKLAI